MYVKLRGKQVLEKKGLRSVCICLVPRPQYYPSVIRFGSCGPGRKVWPGQKIRKVRQFISLFFTEPISSRGREFFEHNWERDRKRKTLKTPRFRFNVNWSN